MRGPSGRSSGRQWRGGVLGLAAILGWLWGAGHGWALEFVAVQITRVNGHSHTAHIYYRDDRWRLEHDRGPVNITIIRKDKQLSWFLLSRMKHFKSGPFDPQVAPQVSATLEDEVSREAIGTEEFDGHPTTLYEVTVRRGPERAEAVYYQWLAEDLGFPLKLVIKNGDWAVEYRHLRLGPVSDFYFELPLSYLPLDEPLPIPRVQG